MKEKILNKILPIKKQLDEVKIENEKLKKQNKQFKKEVEKLEKLNSFINFQEFLSNSYVSPIVKAPFSAQDKRVFAFMDHISKYLIQNTTKNKHKPLVSIIMHTCNEGKFIQNSIDSILKQTYENWELIIIDNGNADKALNSLNKHSNNKIKIVSCDENRGIGFALNSGLNEATGEYIMYLESDNEWDSRYIETMIGAFIELPNADAVYSGQLLYKNHDSRPFAVRFGSLNKSLLHNRNYVDLNCFCHKNHIEEFDENLTQLVEWDYILRITNNFKTYSIPVLLSKFYESTSQGTVSNYSSDYYQHAAIILKKNILPPKKYEKLSRKVSIIIPSYESLNELKICVDTISSFNFKDMVDIIIVDNNSNIKVKNYLKTLESKQIKIILNEVNYGFTYAVNQGIELSDKNSDILLLNNDAILTPGSLEHLQTGAYSYNDCGLIVPHELVSEKNPHMNYHVPYADHEFKCDVTPSKEHHNIINIPVFHDGELLELNFAPFFCTYIKREVYDKTFGLDPELGRHYRSDRVFSDFVRHILKMKIYQEPNAYVYHKHRIATSALRNNKQEFELMFNKNQWPSDLANQLGYKKPLWDY